MTHTDLVQHSVRWLRSRMKCTLVFAEISTGAWIIPDAIGWCRQTSFLIECKRTRHDFFADKEKFAHKMQRVPGKFRWYVTPAGLVAPDEVPEGWGLAEVRGKRTFVITDAPRRQLTELERDEETRILSSAIRRLQSGRSQYDPRTARFSAWR